MSRRLMDRQVVFPPPDLKTYGLKVVRQVWEGEPEPWFKFDLPDGVQVLPFNEEGKVIAIRQERNSIPYLGLVGETMNKDEVHAFRSGVEARENSEIARIACEVARRGLREETGYEAGDIEFLAAGLVNSSKGIPSHSYVLARSCRKVAEPEQGIVVELWSPEDFFLTLRAQFLAWPALPKAGVNSMIAATLGLPLGLPACKPADEFRGTPTVVALRGLPLSGKTSLGRALAKELGWHFIDVDYCRRIGAGDPERDKDLNPYAASEERKSKEGEDMRIAYTMMHDAVRLNINLGRSVICAATYSRRTAQKFLLDIVRVHPGARLKGIRCVFNDIEEEVRRRIASVDRDREGGCKTVEHYLIDKNVRHDYTDLWGVLEVNTSEAVESCVAQALDFIQIQE